MEIPLKSLDQIRLAQYLTDKYLSLTILPTEQCNFRCVYCYEDFSIGKMKPETVSAIKKLITKRAPDLDELSISWFGGEPLVAKDIILDIAAFAMRIAQERPAFKFNSGMTTNASLLTPHLLEKLVDLNVTQYQVSLDGPKEFHDKTRLRLGGSASFDAIWKNLLAARALDKWFKFKLRLHVTPQNYEHMHELVDQIKTAFGDDPRYNFFFREIGNYGGPNVGKFDILEGEKRKKAMTALLSSVRNTTATTTEYQDPSTEACYAGKANAYVIRADGSLAKCTVAFSDPRNMIGRINSDGSFTINNKLHQVWLRGLKTLDPQTLHCPLSNFPKESDFNKNLPPSDAAAQD